MAIGVTFYSFERSLDSRTSVDPMQGNSAYLVRSGFTGRPGAAIFRPDRLP